MAIAILVLVLAAGCAANYNDWNRDQNSFRAPHYQNQNGNLRSVPRPNVHRGRIDLDDPYSQYSHNQPVIIRAPKKVYKPREDPAQFYNNMSKPIITVRSFHPGVDMRKIAPRDYNENSVDAYSNYRLCIRCPSDTIGIARKGREKIVLNMPKLQNCDGDPAPSNVKLKWKFGPKFGTLLYEGTHLTIAEVIQGNRLIQTCMYRYNVVVERCPELHLSSDVEAKCPKNRAWGTICTFKCAERNPALIMRGPQRIKCLDGRRWTNRPPICEKQIAPSNNSSWCDVPPIPKHATINCNTNDGSDPSSGLPEGTKCEVVCSNVVNTPTLRNTKTYSITCKFGIWFGEVPVCLGPRRHKRLLQKINDRPSS